MSRVGMLDLLAFLPSGLTVGQARAIPGRHDDGICLRRGRRVVAFADQRVHWRGSRGCRSASFDANHDWDDWLRQGWQAAPGGQEAVDECHVCELLSGRSQQQPPLDLRDGAGRVISWEQRQAWVIAQAVRGQLEAFHGGGAADPDNPDSGEGFISDNQMRALNIVIRHAVDEALTHLGAPTGSKDSERFVEFQLATVRDYMEPPGSLELQQAHEQAIQAE